ncbi:MAG: glycogen/starch synthase, partial [Candidatus Nanoarchaeia archaeon]|nr:glycogen/starch synthase [Candidatus Nanoarchaeia archaeon]
MVGFDKLFEISFEICNKVGGIYTVISSKANLFVKNYSEKYVAVGPYYKQNNGLEFLEKEIPIEFKEINNSLLKKGIIIHYGVWGIKGKPQTILIETNEKYKNNLNDLKISYWNDFGLDSLNAGFDFDEPLIWASAVGEFIKEYANKNKNNEIVAHAHEWLSGFSIMQLKETKNVRTIFTTHATMLGRTLCSHGYNIYNEIEKYNPIELAYKYNIQSKFLTEKICANISDCFTTVSKITGIETKYFFGKEPDVITENGLDSDNYYDSQENVVRQLEASSMLREFISYYFTPYYLLDSSKSIILFISGRYEFKNKGMDLFIRALGKLNEKLKELNFKKNVVVFFWVPRDVKNINNSLLYQKSKYRHFRTLIDRNIEDIKEKIM